MGQGDRSLVPFLILMSVISHLLKDSHGLGLLIFWTLVDRAYYLWIWYVNWRGDFFGEIILDFSAILITRNCKNITDNTSEL